MTLGETMALLTPPFAGPLRHAGSLRLGIAGAESNLAVGVARLGGSAAWIGRVGNDEFGHLVHNTIRGEGVHAIVVTDPSAPTGLMLKESRTPQVTRVQYYRADSAGSRLHTDDLDESVITDAHFLHVTGITTALSDTARAAVHTAVSMARAAGVRISLDVNHRTALASAEQAAHAARELLPGVDVLFVTEEEAGLLVTAQGPVAQARALTQLGPANVVVKRGAEGAVAVADGVVHTQAPVPVTQVDAVGAGDAFASAYLLSLARQETVELALAAAARSGAFAVTVPGDWEGLPFPEDLGLLDLAGQGDVQR